MAQMLTTFSSLEQSRFQAYKRATFAADTVEQWVAACLQDRYQDTTSTSTSTTYPRPLEDLVAPGQAQDIGLVVAIAAKIYAQRLVAEAVALQEKQAAAAKLLPTSGSGGTPACCRGRSSAAATHGDLEGGTGTEKAGCRSGILFAARDGGFLRVIELGGHGGFLLGDQSRRASAGSRARAGGIRQTSAGGPAKRRQQ